MLINPNETSSAPTRWYTVCGPGWGKITAKEPLICNVGTLHHPACASPEVAGAASADVFHYGALHPPAAHPRSSQKKQPYRT